MKSCAELAAKYQQKLGYQVTDRIPLRLMGAFPIIELIVLEMLENTCKSTPQSHSIILKIDIQDELLQVSSIGVSMALSVRDLERIFTPVDNFAAPSDNIAGVGLALVDKLVLLLGGSLQAMSQDKASLILSMPIGSRPDPSPDLGRGNS